MEHLIPNILTFILPYITKFGETFYTETIKEAAKDSWKKIKSFFQDSKSEKIISKVENGEDDKDTISDLKNLFEEKMLADNTFKEILLRLTNEYNTEIFEVLKRPAYKFDNNGNVIIGNPVYKTINNTTIKNYITKEDKEFYSLFNKNIISLNSINNQIKENVESKLLNVKYLINIKNYSEANRVCDDIREIYSQVPEVWEYKAICEYFIDTQKDETINNSARKVLACLNIAKELRKNENGYSYNEICQEISNRYFKTIVNRISKIISNNLKTYKDQIRLFKLITELKTCFEIYNDNKYLKLYVDLFAGLKGFTWLSFNNKDASSKYYNLNENIKLIDNSPTSETIQNLLSKAKEKINGNRELDYNLPEIVFFYEKFGQSFNYNELLNYLKLKRNEVSNKIEMLKSDKLNFERSKTELENRKRNYNGFFTKLFNKKGIAELEDTISSLSLKINETQSSIDKEKDNLKFYM